MKSESLFKKEYGRLNPEQKKAVDTIEGPVMVVAGPGTGKTQILTLRIANILEKTDSNPENILALTFTNSGVFSMRKRLNEMVGDTAYRVGIFTFHAFCDHLIKEFPSYFPEFEYSKVIDELEKVKLIEEIIDDLELPLLKAFHDDYMHLNSIKKSIDSIKQEGLNPHQFKESLSAWKDELFADDNIYYKRKFRQFEVGDMKPSEKTKIENKLGKAHEIANIYEKYQLKISELKRYDFSDMILSVLRELKANEEFKFDVQEKYQYILVDEHQDTNSGQNELIELLTDAEHLGGHPNIFTVGDEKQSIYRFQGASEETFSHFNNIYRDIEHISLRQNYRSIQNILSGAHSVIGYTVPNSQSLLSNRDENYLIRVGGFSNYKMELMYVAQDIKEKLSAGVSPEEIAVIFRSNKHTEDIKNILSHYKIPFVVHSKDSVFNDTDISNIINLLRVVLNPNDDESLAKALFINFIGIDAYDAVKILHRKNYFAKAGKNLFDVINDKALLTEADVKDPGTVLAFAQIIKNSITEVANNGFVNFLKKFIYDSGYATYMLKSEMSQSKLLKLDKLFDEVKKRSAAQSRFSLPEFISMVDSFHKYGIDIENDNPEIESGVQLMTAHGSKGKEFEYVYIINTTRKNWEASRGFGGISLPIKSYQGGEHDERRLFYVAMTRAKLGLVITYSDTDWEGKEQEKSQFIGEIPDEFVEVVKSTGLETQYLKDLNIFTIPSEYRHSVFDKEFIAKTFQKQGLNLTALNNFIECKIKYFYRNLVKIPSPYSPFLSYGNAVHAALEKFFGESKKEQRVVDKDILLEEFSVQIGDSDMPTKDKEKYKAKGLESLSGYYDRYCGEWSFKVLLEQFVARDFDIGGSNIKLTGKIDKIEFLNGEQEGPIGVVDYKTGKTYSEKGKDQKEALERQIVFYYVLLEGFHGDKYRIDNAVLDFIEKNKKEEYEKYTVIVDQYKIDGMKEKIAEVSNEIIRADFMDKGCGKRSCEWCDLHNRIHTK